MHTHHLSGFYPRSIAIILKTRIFARFASMPLVIDTYNVLHTVGVLPPELAGLDLEGLARLVAGSRHGNENTTLVCDGLPEAVRPKIDPPVTVRFAGRDRTADDLIGQIVRLSSAPRRLVVVSSDHAVQRTARKRRCKVLTSQEFLQQLADDAVAAGAGRGPTPKAPRDMSEQQVDRWLEIFSIDEQTAAIPTRGKSSGQSLSNNVTDIDNQQPHQSSDQSAPQPLRQIPELRRGEEMPDSIVEQAERMWRQSQPKQQE